jgi:hypothetical protein
LTPLPLAPISASRPPAAWRGGPLSRHLRVECAGLPYDSFVATKTTYNCNCAGATFHERAYVTGGNSFAAGLIDFVFRLGTTLFVAIAWPIALVSLAVLVVYARRRARQRSG